MLAEINSQRTEKKGGRKYIETGFAIVLTWIALTVYYKFWLYT